MTGEGSLTLTWITDPQAMPPLFPEWRQLAERTGAEIFLTPGWFALWWDHFGRGQRFACLTARQGSVLAGVLPFCIDTLRLGPLPLRVARLAGTDPHCIVFDLPILPGLEPALLRAAMAHLLGPMGCTAVSLTPVSERAAFLPLITADGIGQRVTDLPAGSHVMFDLPGSFDAYLAGLSRNRRSQFRSDLRGLESRFAMTSRAVVPDAAGFRDFVAFHNRQWQAIGKGGHFSDWPGSAAFYAALSDRSRPGWGVRLDRLDGGVSGETPEPMASVFSLVAGRSCHSRLPARTDAPEAEKLSIGKTALLLMIRDMIEAGITRIEAGRGEYDYKLSLGGVNVPVHRMLISGDGGFARLRLRLLLGYADLVNLLYYRLWFLKLAPVLRQKLGMKPRPLWRLWLRTRV